MQVCLDASACMCSQATARFGSMYLQSGIYVHVQVLAWKPNSRCQHSLQHTICGTMVVCTTLHYATFYSRPCGHMVSSIIRHREFQSTTEISTCTFLNPHQQGTLLKLQFHAHVLHEPFSTNQVQQEHHNQVISETSMDAVMMTCALVVLMLQEGVRLTSPSRCCKMASDS